MLQLFTLLNSGIVVMMGPCGFISVQLSIFHPDLETLISLFNISMGKWFWSLCPGPVPFLRWKMVGLIVGSVWFAVSVLRLFPSGVVNNLDSEYSARRLSVQVRKYVSVPALIVLLLFVSIVFLTSTVLLAICSILLLAICSIYSLVFWYNRFARVWYNCFASQLYSYMPLIFIEKDLMIFLTIFFSHILFILWGYTITIDGNIRKIIEMCSTMFRIRCTTFGWKFLVLLTHVWRLKFRIVYRVHI